MPDDNGVTVRQHLEQAWQSTGIKPALLEDEPEINAAVQHIWVWFNQLSVTRGGGFGPAAIAYQEIDAWARLTGNCPTQWEVDQIARIDGAWFKVRAEKDKDLKTDAKK